MRTRSLPWILALAALAAAVGEPPAPPPTFSDPTAITNAFAAFAPGVVRIYAGRTEDAALVVVQSDLAETREFAFAGQVVSCVARRELEYVGGALVSDSLQYLAQSDAGDVHQFGEIVAGTDDQGERSYEGSWLVGGASAPDDPEAAADAGAPIVLMLAAPVVGDSWRTDESFPLGGQSVTVVAAGVGVTVGAGHFDAAIVVREASEPPEQENERKWYAPEVGLVQSAAADESAQLVAVVR